MQKKESFCFLLGCFNRLSPKSCSLTETESLIQKPKFRLLNQTFSFVSAQPLHLDKIQKRVSPSLRWCQCRKRWEGGIGRSCSGKGKVVLQTLFEQYELTSISPKKKMDITLCKEGFCSCLIQPANWLGGFRPCFG